MTKEEWIENEVQTVWQDKTFITHVVREYFSNVVKDLSDEEFKQFLIEHGWEERIDNED